MGHDLEAAARVAEAAADVAAAVIRPFFRERIGIVRKGDASPVTAADRAAEKAIRALLSERFPEHGILGEEFGPEREESPFQWVLDPIDGTKSFITGRPSFGTLIALLHEGVPVLGVINQPITGERWVGLAGRPTRFSAPPGLAAPCGTRQDVALADAQLSCTTLDLFTAETRPRWERLAARVAQVTWGGDCYAHGLLALGTVDLVAETTYKIWDWAAIVPVVEGAGGVITDWSGRPLRPGADGSVLAAGSAALHAEALAILSGS
ncbi:histidinol-phosphatase [Elioraea rosea]|uniref:histidinol-phosphatase n=1 Tax=Elioraea rosea TaxID=2492390 RepID=UPI0011830C2D|nr:histidinol-phosphatase [Elioraea rosea]